MATTQGTPASQKLFARTSSGLVRAASTTDASLVPGISFEPIRLVCSGPSAVVEWAQSSVVEAPLDGTPGAGTELFLRAVDIFHVAGGLVQHESSWYGDGWLRQRLGGDGEVPRLRRSR